MTGKSSKDKNSQSNNNHRPNRGTDNTAETSASSFNNGGMENGYARQSTSSKSAVGDDMVSPLPSSSFTHNPLLVIENGIFHNGNAINSTSETWEDIMSNNVRADDCGFTVRGVNMSVHAGEILAIVGPVGCGKR